MAPATQRQAAGAYQTRSVHTITISSDVSQSKWNHQIARESESAGGPICNGLLLAASTSLMVETKASGPSFQLPTQADPLAQE
eukprot:scaffold604070_cov25-Prasinocladus_malaysianus.AAC.1